MILKKVFFLVLIIFCNTFLYAQKHELGDVTIEELKEKVCPIDTSAVAAVMFDIGKIYYDFSDNSNIKLVTEVVTKIKIYKKKGYEYGNKIIQIHNTDMIDIKNASTYNLVNNQIEKTKLSNDGEFIEKANENWKLKKIIMPNVKEGSIIEYKIKITSYIGKIDEWVFQKDIPVNYSEFLTIIPEYFIFKTRSKGYSYPKVMTEENEKFFSYSSMETLSYRETKTKYTLENVPALKEEPFVNNMNNYRATLIHELTSIKFPNQRFEKYSNDWETVTKTIYQSDSFGAELKKTGYFENDLDVVLNGITVRNERIYAVFDYVKSRMNWDETYGISCYNGVKKAYQDKKGNAAEINLMLIAMLRYAGIEVNPILVSTRSNGLVLFPSLTAFNYVISGIELANQVVLLDATNKYAIPDILPLRDLNWLGRIVRKNESSDFINLMPKSKSNDMITVLASLNDKGEVSGKVKELYFDYNAFVYRDQYNSVSKDSYIEKLEKKYQGIEILDYDVQNRNDLSKPVIESYAFSTKNAVEIIGDKMYFSPFLFFAQTENVFKQEKREFPIDFIYPKQDKYLVTIAIPDGYEIETSPNPKSIAMPDELGLFVFNISNNGKQVQMLFTLDLNQAVIQADHYEELKAFFMEMVDKQNEKIILEKI